jgi:transposase
VLRQLFNERITNYKKQGKTIVYIDESGFESDMSRPYGYAHIGQKCAGKSDWHSKKRINAIGAITDFFLITVTLFAGSINSEVFFQWVIQDLLPKLPESCVIVMDNATFHKRLDIQHAIKANGHLLEYLPVYSPDLNPIEHYWAKVKAIRRKEQCTVEDLFAHKI